MPGLSTIEEEAIARAADAPMLDQVLEWAAINSGSRNLEGLERMAALLADAFSSLPGELERTRSPFAVDGAP
jgi:glutamate carboxypeptidase